MRKTKEKISFDLDWQLRKEARALNLTVDQLIRKIYEEWKKSQPQGSNNKNKLLLKRVQE